MMIRWFLAPPAAWTRLPFLRAGLINVPGHRGRADERDRAHQGMRQERIDALLVAVHDVEDPLGQPRLHQQLAQPDGRQRDLFRGLQDERVAADDRDREHPERDHRREVERRDARADADRVADRLAVDLPGDVRQRLAHDQAGHAAGELDDLDAALDRRSRLGERLAVLARDQARQLLGVWRRAFRETGTSPVPARRPASRPRPAAPRRPLARRDRPRRPCRTGPRR